MRLYLIAVVVWAGTVTATLESDSHGNWSNEKEIPTYSYIYEIKEGVKTSQTGDKSNSGKVEDNSGDEIQSRYSSTVQNLNERPYNSSWSDEFPEGKNETSIPEIIDGDGNDYDKDTQLQTKTLDIAPPDSYVVEIRSPIEETVQNASNVDTSEILTRLTRMNQKTTHESRTFEYSPSREILIQNPSGATGFDAARENDTNESENPLLEDYPDFENAGGFGQRVRSSFSLGDQRIESSSHGKLKLLSPERTSLPYEEIDEYKKQDRGKIPRTRGLYSSKKMNHPNNVHSSKSKPLTLEEIYRIPAAPFRHTEQQIDSRPADFTEKRVNVDNLQDTDVKSTSIPVINDEETQRSADREYTPKKHRNFGTDSGISKGTFTTNPSGKFLGPIVVPEFPRYEKLPHLESYSENYEAPDTLKSVSLPEESKAPESNYLATSSVLNSLQAGVALVNAGQVPENANDLSALTEERLREDVGKVEIGPTENRNVDRSKDANSSDKLDSLGDQLIQQGQISKVSQKSPIESVEIQKSVEIYHTAPIQEIHYPPEFVPHVQQTSGKHRPLESGDSRNPQKDDQASIVDRRPVQPNFNIYKSNEILEENIIPTRLQQLTFDRHRQEYNVNENDVDKVSPLVVPRINDQSDRLSTGERGIGNKLIFGAREPSNDALYGQSILQNAKANIEEQAVAKEVGKQYNFDFGKNPFPSFVRKDQKNEIPSTLVNSLPDSAQYQEIPRFVYAKLSKTEKNAGTELKLLPIPHPYPVEKIIEKTVHIPHSIAVDKVIEKKVPYPVEKVIEKQVTIHQPFPVHVPLDRVIEKQIRMPQIYPIHVERVIEKKVPYIIQRFVIQPYPMHHKTQSQSYSIEKPVHVAIEKTLDRRQHPADVPKFVKIVPSHSSYNSQYYDGSHQQNVRPQGYHQPTSNPSYGSFVSDQDHSNSSQSSVYSYSGYHSPNRFIVARPHFVHVTPNKFVSYGNHFSHSSAPSYSTYNGVPVAYGRQTTTDEDKVKNDYGGPASRKGLHSGSIGMQSKSSDVQASVGAASLRRMRQDRSLTGSTGSFKQSKMEYGFKPPMVPSVQYDEKTASKVD